LVRNQLLSDLFGANGYALPVLVAVRNGYHFQVSDIRAIGIDNWVLAVSRRSVKGY
jgi:hypothetical protein